MIQKNPLLKYMVKAQTPDVIHTSGYAKVQNADSQTFGAVSTETFAERRRIEERRKFIQGYRNSRLAAGTPGIPRPKTYTPPAPTNTPTSPAKPTPTPRPAPIPTRRPL